MKVSKSLREARRRPHIIPVKILTVLACLGVCACESGRDPAPQDFAGGAAPSVGSGCIDQTDCAAGTGGGLAGILLYGATHAAEVRSAKAASLAAQSDVAAARWGFWPTPYASYVNSTSNEDDEFQIGLEQTLWAGGQLKVEHEIAQLGAGRADVKVAAAQRSVAFATLDAFGDLYAAYYRRQAWEQALASHETLLKTIEARHASGFSSEADLVTMRSHIAVTRTRLENAQAQLKAARAGIARYVPLELSDSIIRDARAKAIPENLQNFLPGAIDADPEIAVAKLDVHRAKLEADRTHSMAFPRIYARVGQAVGNGGSGDDPVASIGVQTRFGAGLSLLSARKRAEAARAQAEADVDTIREKVSSEIQNIMIVAVAARRQGDSYSALVADTKILAQSYRRQFLSGEKSWVDLMSVHRDIADYESELASVNAAHLVASWKLFIYLRGAEALGVRK